MRDVNSPEMVSLAAEHQRNLLPPREAHADRTAQQQHHTQMPGSAPRVALPPVKKGKLLSFPPLTKNWTVKGEPKWPGAEYTRRTRMKTTLEQDISAEFLEEMKELLGEHYEHYETAMHPNINRKLTRGKPPDEKGDRKIQPSYTLRRSTDDEGGEEGGENPLAATTRSLSGHLSKSKTLDSMTTPWGTVPEYMFEDRERMVKMDEWFDKYGRPTEGAINLGPRNQYTEFTRSSRRCCGEPSARDKMKKGFVTA